MPPTYVDFEGEKIKVFAIVDKTVMEYFWYTSLELARHNVKRVGLSATDPYVNTMERLIKHWSQYGVETVEGSRGRRRLLNPKKNEQIDVNFVIIERLPILESV